MENRYITLEVKGLTFQVKMEDEGVVVDVFDEDGEVIETTAPFYEDLGIEEVKWIKE